MRTAVRKGSARLLAAVLCVVMLLGLAPVGAVAQPSESAAEFDRIVHLDMGRKYYSPTTIKTLIDRMAELGYNQLELDISNNEKGQFRFALDDMDVTFTKTVQTRVLVQESEPAEETPSAALESSAVSAPVNTEEPSAATSSVPAPAETAETVAESGAASGDQAVQAVVEEVEQLDQPVGSTSELEFEYVNTSADVTVDLSKALPNQGQYITESEMKGIISYALENGIEIVPLLNTPGHMGAILDTFPEYSYNGSNSLDVTDDDARAFGMAVVEKYAKWFMDQGCSTINIGADEFANDLYLKAPGMGFGHLVRTGEYSYFVSYVNKLAGMLQEMGYTVRAFNDGINYGGQSGVDSSIQVCYWTGGWDSYDVASAEELADAGFTLINTHGDYYYILGKDSSMTNGTIQASNFDPESFSGNSTVYDPAGAMFCIWSDYPNAQTEEEVLSGVQSYLEGFASALTVPVRDSQTGVSVTASGVTEMAVKAATVAELSGQDYVAYDMQPTRADGSTYSGSAQVSIPLPANLQGYPDEQLTGFVVENGIPTPVKGTRSGDTYTFEMPHFSVGGVMALSATAATEYEQATSVEAGGQYLVVYQSGGRYYAMDKDGYARQLTMSGGKLDIGENNADDLLWTFDKSGSGWTITDGDGQKLGMSGEYKSSIFGGSWTITADFNNGGTQNTFAVNPSGSGWIIQTANQFTSGRRSQYGYLIGEYSYYYGCEFTGSTKDSTLYLYESAEPTYTVTIQGIDEAGKSIGTTTVQLPAGVQTVSAPEFPDYTVIRNDPDYPDPATVMVTADHAATVTFRYRESINADPLEVEFWITNRPVTANGSNSMNISANDTHTEEGVLFSELVPANGTYDNNDMAFWKGTVLDRYNHQTQDSGDKTQQGTDFTYLRYWDGAWQYSSDRADWKTIASTDQVVAYYLQVTDVTKEVTTQVVDWGVVPATSYDQSNFVFVDYAVVYENGEQIPDAFPVDKTIAFHCDPNDTKTVHYDSSTRRYYRDIGMIRAVETDDYEVYMITLTPSSDSASTTIGNRPSSARNYSYNGTEKVVWVDDEADLGEFSDPSKQHEDFKVGGDAIVPGLEIYNQHGMLVRYYIRPVNANLTINYLTEGSGTPFYSMGINAVNPQTFTGNGYNGKPFLSGNQLVTETSGEFAGQSQATVLNDYNNELHVNPLLETIPGMPAAYRYRKYTLVRAEVTGEGGTVLNLYYTFAASAYTFVADYGLPMEIKLSDIGINVSSSDIVRVTPTGGGLTWDSTSGTLKFQFSSTQQGAAVSCSVLVTTNAAQGENTIQSSFDVYPASTVYYEAEDQSFVNYSGSWTNVGASSGGSQQTERLGSSSAYGSDQHYNTNQVTWSNGAAKQVTVSDANGADWPTATFTFTGTGVDIISRTDSASGTVLVEVKDTSSAQEVKAYLVNGYYGYTYANGQWTVNPSSTGMIYQVPVIKVDDLAYGTYEVTVKPFYSDLFDVAGKNSFTFYLDAIRVYNPLNTGSVYAGDGEASPTFVDLSKQVASFASSTFIDGNPAADKDTYLNYGPNHEIYLSAGQSVTLTLSDPVGKNAQIGARVMEGSAGTITVGGQSIQVKGDTDQYYEITNGVGNTVTITNTGSTRIALTTLKLTSK